MKNHTGLTRIDLVVVMACLVFILANVLVITAAGRGRAKLEVCLLNLRSLTDAWQMQANDNNGKITSGDVLYSWAFPSSAGGLQGSWFESPHQWHPCPLTTTGRLPSIPYAPPYISFSNATQEDWHHSITDGKLWQYVRNYNIYRCPVGAKNQYVTYSMSMSMNTYPNAAGNSAPILTNINQIIRPVERCVFLDVGVARQGAFYISYNGSGVNPTGRWYDLPPMQHNQGTTLVFADGHAIYRKWTDPHVFESVDLPWGGGTVDYCDCDLRWMTKITWGQLSYEWDNCTDSNCPD